MHSPIEKVRVLFGNVDEALTTHSGPPYSDDVCSYLNELADQLMKDSAALEYPDVVSFAFWCRKTNISKLRHGYNPSHIRLGLGTVFHIAPANVPINFAFSYAFSLLAGNSNVVRVSSKDFPQTAVVLSAIEAVLSSGQYAEIKRRTCFVSYEHDETINAYLSANCSARIIWGGDDTIGSIRRHPIPIRGIDVAFADRYSFCAIRAASVTELDNEELIKLASGFYNDTYLNDQNACSSPHLIVWVGRGHEITEAKKMFWETVAQVAESRYELQPIQGVDKFTHACRNALDLGAAKHFTVYKNYVYTVDVDSLDNVSETLRGQCGYFYQYDTENINEVAGIVTNRYQTLTYYGLDKIVLADFIINNKLAGIDRIVPIGSALDISIIWDGLDLVSALSRICEIR